MDNLENEEFIRNSSDGKKVKKKKKIKLIHWLVVILVLLCVLASLVLLVIWEKRDEKRDAGKIEEYTLGIEGEAVNEDMESISGKDMPNGVYVLDVEENSLAYRAGIMKGDIITEVNGNKINKVEEIDNSLRGEKEGTKIAIIVKRQDKDEYKKVKLSVKIKVIK